MTFRSRLGSKGTVSLSAWLTYASYIAERVQPTSAEKSSMLGPACAREAVPVVAELRMCPARWLLIFREKWCLNRPAAGVSHLAATSPALPCSALWIRSDSHSVIR